METLAPWLAGSAGPLSASIVTNLRRIPPRDRETAPLVGVRHFLRPQSPRLHHEAARRRLPITPLPTISLMIVIVSLAASLGGKAVSAILQTSFVMS